MSKPQHKPVGFREFLIGDLFEDPIRGVRIISDLRVKGDIPLITAGYEKEGIAGYIQPLDFQKIMDGLNITIDMFGNVFLRNHEYVADDNILSIDFSDFNENIGLYIVAVLRKKIQGFNYSKQFRLKTYYNLTIQLPVLANNQPDYEYMDYFVEELKHKYVEELKHKYVEELDAWWSQAGFASLSDTLLTGNDRNILNKYQQAQFKDFLIGDLFDKVKVKTFNGGTGDLPSQKVGDYVLPMLTAGINHQGLNNYDTYEDDVTVLKNVISISANGANTGAAFFQNQEFGILQDAYAIDFKDQNRNYTENIYLYVLSVINKKFEGKFSWTLKAGWNRVKELSIQLPVDINDQPDYDLISQYMQVMKKLTIQTHRAWLDEQLAEHQSLI